MRPVILFLMLLMGVGSFAQNELLAKNYFDQGEYEKAVTIYDKLHRKSPNRLDYLMALVESNQQLERFDASQKLLEKRLSSNRVIPQLYIELGHNYSLQNKDSLASVQYKIAIDYIDENPRYASSIGNTFEKRSLLDEAILVYERAMVLEPAQRFDIQLARIYGEQGNLNKMFEKYIDLMERNPVYKNIAQRNFSSFISEDSNNEANIILRKTLLQKLQKNPQIIYNELLSWLFIQQKEFKKAFTQEKAIFKRTQYDLSSITDLGLIALAAEDYENAKNIINFVIENSSTPEAKLQGYQYLMQVALETTTEKDYPKIEQQFQDLFTEYGSGAKTYLLQIDYNHFLAFNAGKKETAIANLKTLSKKRMTSYQEARVKMELADILVFDEKFNQALIYYSQIQKKVKSDVLAQEARFKVAQTSYFKGDFPWAQVQLDVLRKSSSQLIANDAMQLNLMITDNSLEDSTQTALKKFARADLMALQHKYVEGIAALDDILTNHKGEKIEDEALLKQGELFENSGQFEKAEANYLKLIELYNEDILADDAHYRLAKLYENELLDPEKAKQFYERIIFDFADSIYFVEARKKFRLLRGDAIN